MSTTTERKVTVASGLGDADASQVMAGATFSSESGFNQEGEFIPSADNITYNNATSKLGSTNTQGAIDEIVTLTNESGHSIDVTLNKSTYVMAISLKDKNGEVLNEKTVDFPMETAFVNASYDKASKTMKFTLESGSTVDVPLGDLVEGLVSQTDFDVLSGEVETLKTEVKKNTNAIERSNYFGELVHQKGEFHTGMGINNGTPVSTSNYDCYWMIPIEPNTVYYNTLNVTFYWYDENKTFIKYTSDGLSPSNARYLGIDFKTGTDVKVYKGIYADDISHINDSLSALGKCKNLLKTTLGSGNGNGITYVNNGDGTYTLSGTASKDMNLDISSNASIKGNGKLKRNLITLSGTCSQNITHISYTSSWGYGGAAEMNTPYTLNDGIIFTLFRIKISSGTVCDNLKVAFIVNDNPTEFCYYTGDGDTLTSDVAKVNERTSLNLKLTLEQGDLDEDGILVSSTEYKRTINYIKVKPNTEYTVSRSSTSNLYVVGFQAKGIAITDGTKTNNKFIVYESTQTNVSFTTTNTTQYIKVVVKNLDLSEKITLDTSNSIGETVSDNTNNIVAINSNMSDYGLNNVFDGVWNQDTDGGKVISNYYSVNSGDTIRIENCSGDAVVLLYNSSKQWQSNIYNAVENVVVIPSDISYFRILLSSSVALTPTTADKIRLYINNQIDVVKNDVNVLKNDKEDKYTLELNHFTKCVDFENVVNADEYFEAMVFDRSDKKKYIKVSGYRPSENAEENEISYINLGSKTLNIVGSNNQTIMFSGGSEVYDAYIKAIR